MGEVCQQSGESEIQLRRWLAGESGVSDRRGEGLNAPSSQCWSRPVSSAGRVTMMNFSCSVMGVIEAAIFTVIGPRWRLSQKGTGSVLSVWPK